MFAVEVYAAVRHFVMIDKNSQRDAARVFGLSRVTISKMCRFSLPPGYLIRVVAKGGIRSRHVRPVEEVVPNIGPKLPNDRFLEQVEDDAFMKLLQRTRASAAKSISRDH